MLTAVKALSSDRIGGYLVVWGDPAHKDLQGEYFTRDTDLGRDWPLPRPALYHHGLDGTLKSSLIGVIDTLVEDDTGLWAEAQLDMRNQYVRAVLQLIERGALGWSSGSLPQLADIDRDGRIKRWPIVEGSLTPTPAEPRRTQITALKSIQGRAEFDDLKERLAREGLKSVGDDDDAGTHTDQNPLTEITMNVNELIGMVLESLGVEPLTDEQMSELTAAVQQKIDAGKADDLDDEDIDETGKSDEEPAGEIDEEALTERVIEAVVEEVRELEAKMKRAQKSALRAQVSSVVRSVNSGRGGESRAPGGHSDNRQRQPQISGMKTQYEQAGLSHEDMAYMHTIQKAIGNRAWQPGKEFYRELATKAEAASRKGGARLDNGAMKAISAIKADELVHTGNTNFGEEWIPNLWLDRIWLRERMDNVVARNLPMIEMPSNPYTLPMEGIDPDVYYVAETTDVSQLTDGAGNATPMSKVGTAQTVMTARKMALRLGISAEQEEDAIIPTVAENRRQAQRTMEDAIDSALLNGDDTGIGNINFDGVDAPATNAHFRAVPQGILYAALVAGDVSLRLDAVAETAVDAPAGVPDLAMLRKLRFALARPYRNRKADLMYVIDSETEGVLINVPELKDYFYRGTPGSVITGEVARIDNIPVYVSNEFQPSAANGKVSSTGANNTRGRVSLVYKPAFKIGYRRNIRVTADFFQNYDAYLLMATVRVALVRKDDACVSVLYNIQT